jgi:hypothetical protein
MVWALCLGFGLGVICAFFPLFLGVRCLLKRVDDLVDQRDSLLIQLQQSLLELRAVGIVEMIEEDEGEG